MQETILATTYCSSDGWQPALDDSAVAVGGWCRGSCAHEQLPSPQPLQRNPPTPPTHTLVPCLTWAGSTVHHSWSFWRMRVLACPFAVSSPFFFVFLDRPLTVASGECGVKRLEVWGIRLRGSYHENWLRIRRGTMRVLLVLQS